jgi:hypothetical protein
MGRSTTPRYVVEIELLGRNCWNVRHGRKPVAVPPTAANLAKYMDAMLKSMEPGGCNAHLAGIFRGKKPHWARIRENCLGGAVVAEWDT